MVLAKYQYISPISTRLSVNITLALGTCGDTNFKEGWSSTDRIAASCRNFMMDHICPCISCWQDKEFPLTDMILGQFMTLMEDFERKYVTFGVLMNF